MKYLILIAGLLIAMSASAQRDTTRHRPPVFINHAAIMAAPGWHSDTSKITILYTDSTFKTGYKVQNFYRTPKTVISRSELLFDLKWVAVKPENVYDIK